ncbi:MAG: hypothetical protein KAI47_13200, partial [Deltaproteobacteria bacterium]|nr:hypothetical protein [Deltaproteobacteria bacterium]
MTSLLPKSRFFSPEGVRRVALRLGACRLAAVAIFLGLLSLLATPAWGVLGPKKSLVEARRAFHKQDYERALKLLQPVARAPQATISQKVEAFELLGLSYLILGDERRARRAFENLLGLDPEHPLHDPTGSPKLKRFFLAVKAKVLPGYDARQRRVRLGHRVPRDVRAGRRVELVVELLVGVAAVGEVSVRWRRSGSLIYQDVRSRGRRHRVAAFVLPEDRVGYRIEYYVEARSPDGHVLARLGTASHPRSFDVAAASQSARGAPVYKRWWFWTGVG